MRSKNQSPVTNVSYAVRVTYMWLESTAAITNIVGICNFRVETKIWCSLCQKSRREQHNACQIIYVVNFRVGQRGNERRRRQALLHNFEEMMTRNFWRLVQLLSVEMSLKYSPLNSSLIYNASAAFILGKNMKYWVIYLGFVCPAQNTELCNSNFKGNYSTSKN